MSGQAEGISEVLQVLEQGSIHSLKSVSESVPVSKESLRPEDSETQDRSSEILMPEYLTKLFSVGCRSLYKAEQGSYAKLLGKDQDVFCKQKIDLGLTDVAELMKSKCCRVTAQAGSGSTVDILGCSSPKLQFQSGGPDIPPTPLWKKRKKGADLS